MTQHDNILIVPLPEDVSPIDINYQNELICSSYSGTKYYKLPPSPWRIVGRAKELTEGQWHGIVEAVEVAGGNEGRHFGYVNYEEERQHDFNTATESGQSLLLSHGIDPESNPLILIKEK